MHSVQSIQICSQERYTRSIFCAVCAVMEGQNWGVIRNYASSSTASNHALTNSYSCECIGSLSINSQPAYFSPKVMEQVREHANTHRMGLSLSLVMQSLGQRVCPLSPTGSQRLNDLSMLAGSTHCDVRVKDCHILPS